MLIVGEAAALTAQTTELPDGTLLRFGTNRDDTDNRQFTLNILLGAHSAPRRERRGH